MPTTEWLHRSIGELLKTGQLVTGQIVAFSKSTFASVVAPEPDELLSDVFMSDALMSPTPPARYIHEFVFIRHENTRSPMIFILGLSPEHGTVLFRIPETTQVAVRKL